MKICWSRGVRIAGLMIACAALMIPVHHLHAQEVPTGKAPTYIPLAPAFVVNYGGVGRLKYLKAEISVRVDDSTSANAVRHHMPLIRNSLVMLFSRQTEEDVKTQEGKERLRLAALAEINTLIAAEDGESAVVDLFFNNLIIQQ